MVPQKKSSASYTVRTKLLRFFDSLRPTQGKETQSIKELDQFVRDPLNSYSVPPDHRFNSSAKEDLSAYLAKLFCAVPALMNPDNKRKLESFSDEVLLDMRKKATPKKNPPRSK